MNEESIEKEEPMCCPGYSWSLERRVENAIVAVTSNTKWQIDCSKEEFDAIMKTVRFSV